jgi:hypothetical protein
MTGIYQEVSHLEFSPKRKSIVLLSIGFDKDYDLSLLEAEVPWACNKVLGFFYLNFVREHPARLKGRVEQ